MPLLELNMSMRMQYTLHQKLMISSNVHSYWFLFFSRNAARNSTGFGGLKRHTETTLNICKFYL